MNRKDEHIKLALDQKIKNNSFDQYKIKYFSIPKFGLDDISTKTKIGNIELEYPFFINAITGGSEKGDKINKDLEYVSKKTGIFLFPGSYSPFLDTIKNNYPKKVGLNLGIDKDVNLHLKAIKDTKAKILQVHINMIQEMLMIEGNKNFEKWYNNLKDIITQVNIPIILKETGFGIDEETIKLAIDMGIKIVDVSGKDGTDFSKIELSRRNDNSKSYYSEIGYSTTNSLINASKYKDKIEIIASGGIRNPLDIIKALALGANAVGISKTFLEILEKYGKEKLVDTIEDWKIDIRNLMLITNSKNINELRKEKIWKEK